jgi:hypothetical protein
MFRTLFNGPLIFLVAFLSVVICPSTFPENVSDIFNIYF